MPAFPADQHIQVLLRHIGVLLCEVYRLFENGGLTLHLERLPFDGSQVSPKQIHL